MPHHYEVALAGRSDGYARLSATGLPDLQTAPPADFDGPGDAWSPEHLFLASIETCFLFTLRAVAQASKLEFLEVNVTARGTVDRKDGATRFTQVVLHPRMALPAGVDKDRALRILEKSEKACLISASLAFPVRLEPDVLIGSRAV